jgi:DNA polymerase-3 subunit beta
MTNNQMYLTATNSSDLSFAQEIVNIESNNTENIEIHFNYNYLLDVLNSIDDEYAEIFLNNPNSQVIIKDNSNKELIYVIMPMSI